MRYSMRVGAGIAAGLAVMSPVQALAQKAEKVEKPGSLHLQCDGNPNNVTAGETAARLIGAVTLLGLFAPPPESADPAKRKFGAEGVQICSSLIDGEKKETNASRRLDLILARAIHRIEAKDYEGAIADAALARSEAAAGPLAQDPYFARGRGRGADLIEAAALLRMGKVAEASDASLRTLPQVQYSFVGQVITADYGEWVRKPSDTELTNLDWRGRLYPGFAAQRAARLEMIGRFAEAARVRDALIDLDQVNSPELNSSVPIAMAGIAHALAGDKALAAQRIAEARANAQKRKSEGKPETNEAALVELFDLYGIIDLSGTDMKGARRLFAARSLWVSASLGTVIEVTKRLRTGAAPDELIGGLAHDGDQLWKDHVDTEITELVAKDKDNATLFRLIPVGYGAGAYESLSKRVWNTKKSPLLLKPGKEKTNKFETLYLYAVAPTIAIDAYVLHAALLAKSRGHAGFVFAPLFVENATGGLFRTGNRGEPGLPDDLFLDADDVIAKLSPIIPSPDVLSARKAKR